MIHALLHTLTALASIAGAWTAAAILILLVIHGGTRGTHDDQRGTDEALEAEHRRLLADFEEGRV